MAAASAAAACAALVAGCATRPSGTVSAPGGRLQQAQRAWRAGHTAAAWQAVKNLSIRELPPARQLGAAELKANIALSTHRPKAALAALAAAPTPSKPAATQRFMALEARALFADDQVASGLELMVRRGRRLTSAADRQANNELTWTLISGAESLPAPTGLSKVAQGWVALAGIERTAWEEPGEFDNRIQDWSANWPNHPANGVLLAQIEAEERAQLQYPPKVAFLLPLSGPYAGQARAVEEGLLAAYYRGARPRPTIVVYDTSGTPAGARAALAKANAGQVDFVVGPLTVAGVNAIVSLRPAMPVLALNYLNEGRQAPPRFFQFGLSPEQEARAVAERAVSQGLSRAVVLVPANDWGRKIGAAFDRRLTSLGGRVLASAAFEPGAVKFAAPLSSLLGLDASQAREQALAATIGQPLGFTPRRRQDIQFVFFAAPFTTARLLVPQIAYYHGMGLPVYSIGNVYQPGATPDDLDGVRFPIMPWFIASGGPIEALREKLAGLFPNVWRDDATLYALGYDAWRLIPMLGNSAHPLSRPVRAVTGTLSLGANNVVVRRAAWAHYVDGKAQPAARTPR